MASLRSAWLWLTLACVAVASGCTSVPQSDFSLVSEGWNGERIACDSMSVWVGFEDQPGVEGTACAIFDLRDPVEGPGELTRSLSGAVRAGIDGGDVTYLDCSVMDDKWLYTFQTCYASISDPDGAPSLINIYVHSSISIDDFRGLIELHKARGPIGAEDFDEIHSTAEVLVAWGEEPE